MVGKNKLKKPENRTLTEMVAVRLYQDNLRAIDQGARNLGIRRTQFIRLIVDRWVRTSKDGHEVGNE